MASVGYATLQIIPSTKGFAAALAGQTGPQMAAVGRDGGAKAGKGFTSGFMPMTKGLVGPLAAVFGALAVGSVLKDSVTEASNLAESVNAVRVSYGKAADAVLALGENSAQTFGLSKVSLNEFAVRFSGFAKTVAGPGGNVAKTFESLTLRATDFASVMNLEVSEAATLFQSGLAGETEPLRRFGIDMSAATVTAFAYANGIAKTGEELTETQKVQARYALLMEQTKKTAGDFANTSGGLANQTRILGAQWDNLKATLGEAFLPLVTKVVSLLNAGLGPAIEWVRGAVDGLTAAFSGSGDKSAGFRQLASTAQTVRDAFASFVGYLQANVFPIVQQYAAIIQQRVIPVVIELATFFRDVVIPAVVSLAQTVASNLKPVFDAIFEVVQNDVLPAVDSLWSSIQSAMPTIKTIAALIVGWYQTLVTVYSWIAGKVLPVLGKLAGLLIGAVARAIGAVIGFLSGAFQAFQKVATGVGTAIRSFGEFLGSVRDKIGAALTFIGTIPGKVKDALSGAATWLVQAGRDLVSGFISGIGQMIGSLADKAREMASSAVNAAKSALGIASPSKVFIEIGKFVGKGFVKGVTKTLSETKSVMERLAALVKEAGDKAAIALVEKTEKRLIDLAKRREKVAERLGKANQKLADQIRVRDDYARGIREGLLGAVNIADAAPLVEGETLGFADVERTLKANVNQATLFAGALAKLRDQGLSKALLDQIIAKGPQAGLAVAEAVLQGGADGITRLNGLQGQLASAASSLGDSTAAAFYQTGVNTAQGIVDGLESQESALTESMRRVAKKMVAALKKELGIKSPSKVFAALGEEIPAGLAAGVDGNSGVAQASVNRLVSVPALAGQEAAVASAVAGRTVVVNNYNPVAEPSSVTVSKTLSRLAFLEV